MSRRGFETLNQFSASGTAISFVEISHTALGICRQKSGAETICLQVSMKDRTSTNPISESPELSSLLRLPLLRPATFGDVGSSLRVVGSAWCSTRTSFISTSCSNHRFSSGPVLELAAMERSQQTLSNHCCCCCCHLLGSCC